MTIELVSSIATQFGVDTSDILVLLNESMQRWTIDRIRRQQQKIARSATSSMLADSVAMYYGTCHQDLPIRQYRFNVNGTVVPTTVYSQPGWLESSRLQELTAASVFGNDPPIPPQISEELRSYGVQRLAQMLTVEAQLWDAPLFALTQLPSSRRVDCLTFRTTSFLRYRFATCLIADELMDALTERDASSPQSVSEPALLLPLRDRLLPSLDALADVSKRVCVGGVSVMFAIANRDDFTIPMQIRSANTADGPGQSGVVPLAFHQPVSEAAEEAHPLWTVLREIHEECLGGIAVDRATKRRFDWYLAGSEALAFLYEHRDSVTIAMTGFGLNALNGNYEIAVSVIVEDEDFWTRFGGAFDRSWEAERWRFVRSSDAKSVSAALTTENQMQESRFALAQGLLYLQRRFPAKIAPVRLECSIGEG